MRKKTNNHLYSSYFISLFYYIFFFSEIEITILSEIHMIIQGQGNQSILNNNFYKEPTEVYVNNIKYDACKKSCELPSDLNNITLIFNEEINSCENMFNGLYNIIEIDLSYFDFSLVTNMNSMFRYCYHLQKI